MRLISRREEDEIIEGLQSRRKWFEKEVKKLEVEVNATETAAITVLRTYGIEAVDRFNAERDKKRRYLES